jgi:hypothetical protein
MDPHIIVLCMSFISFVIDYYLVGSNYRENYPLNIINLSAIYYSMCTCAFLLGMFYKIKPPRKLTITIFPSNLMLQLLCLLNIILNIYLNLVGYKTTHSAIMDKSTALDILVFFTGSINSIIIFIFFFNLFSKKTINSNSNLLILINIILILLFSLLSGSRGSIIIKLLIFPYLYVIFYKKIPIKFITSSFIFFVFIIPISIIYRDANIFYSTTNRGVIEKINIFVKVLKDFKFDTSMINFALSYLFGRVGLLSQNLRIIQFMQNVVPYKMGTTIFPHTIISMVPRFIYRDRPDTNIGKWFGVTFGFTDAKAPVFITAGIFNELFINFSWFGIIFLFILSVLIKKAYSFWQVNKQSLIVNIIYYDFFMTFCFFINESYIVHGLVSIIKQSVFSVSILLIVHLIDRNKKSLFWGYNE